MKSPESVVQALPVPLPSGRPSLPFPRRSTVADLRRLRDRQFREGKHDLALRAATEVAKRDPGRESYLRQGMMLQQVGRYREALEVLRDALRFESGPKYLLPDIHLHIAHTWFLLGKRKRVGESVKRAYALRLKPRTAFNFHMTYGNFLLSKKDSRGALLEYLQSEKVALSALARGRAAVNQGLVFIRQWDFAAAQGPLDRALRMLKKAGHAAELAIARSARAAIYSEVGQHRRAMGMFLHAARTFRRLGKVDRESEVLSNAAYNACALGLWSKALVILDRTISLASATGQHLVLSCAYANLALACAYNEEFDRAASSLAQSQRILRGRRDWFGTLYMCRAQARIAALVGKWREVFRVSRRAERLAAKVGDALRVVEFRKLRAVAEEHLGHRKASSYARKSAGRLEILLNNAKGRESDALASKLAGSEMPILILGESGTNKTGVAREIHRSSGRANGPCIVVPCEHLEFPASDLYGHAEGAWSGATRSAQGYVSSAQGGTIILDCVDQMSPEDQQILVPLLDRKTRAVGGVDERVQDVRVLATCTTMETLTQELRSRLEGAVVRVPSLKDRKSEIPHQVTEIIAGRRKISPDALAELAGHPWEGNLDELRGVVDRLVTFSEDQIGRKLVRRILATSKSRRVRGRVHAPRASRLEQALAR
jgi:transcriptional regulator with AAA-type ATPase domain/Tfp pilus assembly protein PilF